MTVADAILGMLKAALETQGILVFLGGDTPAVDVDEYVRLAPTLERADYPTSKRGTAPLADRRISILVSSCVIGNVSAAETLRNKTVEAITDVARQLLAGLVTEFPEETESEWDYEAKTDKKYTCVHTTWSARYAAPRGTLNSSLDDIDLLIDGDV
jgi:hypothetical protein